MGVQLVVFEEWAVIPEWICAGEVGRVPHIRRGKIHTFFNQERIIMPTITDHDKFVRRQADRQAWSLAAWKQGDRDRLRDQVPGQVPSSGPSGNSGVSGQQSHLALPASPQGKGANWDDQRAESWGQGWGGSWAGWQTGGTDTETSTASAAASASASTAGWDSHSGAIASGSDSKWNQSASWNRIDWTAKGCGKGKDPKGFPCQPRQAPWRTGTGTAKEPAKGLAAKGGKGPREELAAVMSVGSESSDSSHSDHQGDYRDDEILCGIAKLQFQASLAAAMQAEQSGAAEAADSADSAERKPKRFRDGSADSEQRAEVPTTRTADR